MISHFWRNYENQKTCFGGNFGSSYLNRLFGKQRKKPDNPAQTSQSSSDFTTSPETSGGRHAFIYGATQLSVKNGALSINRRSRSESAPTGESGWTILVYLCGSDLESDGANGTIDIEEAMNAQYSDDVHIVYQTGGANQWNNGISNNTLQRYANIDGKLTLVNEIADASMGEAQTLADFVSWGLANYPAENMGLVFWNHGGSISGVCFDENHDKDSLSLREIDTALNSVYDKMTEKFEFIGFDACLMSTLETANILVPYANSVSRVRGQGCLRHKRQQFQRIQQHLYS